MNDSRRRDFLKVAGGVAVVGSLAGCAGEAQEDGGNETQGEEPGAGQDEQPAEEEQPTEEEEQPEQEGQEGTGDDLLRVAHMIPDFPAVDVYIDDSEEPVISDLGYTDVTNYVELGAGDHQIRVTAAGGQSLVVFDQQVSVPAGNTTAVALAQPDDGGMGTGQEGQQNGGQQGGMQSTNFQLELYGDNNESPADSINDSRLRLIHASPDAPAVDVLVGQTTVFETVSYAQAGYFELPAGEYEFEIFPAEAGAGDTGGEDGGGGGNGSGGGDGGGLFSSLAATDGGDISLLQENESDTQEEEESVPEEGEEEETEDGPEPVFTFDVTTESDAVYTAFATGYLDPEAANSEEGFEVVIVQDVAEGDVIEAEDDE